MKRHYVPLIWIALGAPPRFTGILLYPMRIYETWKFVQAKSKQAMKQVLGIRDDKARMTVTPPLAMAPVTQEDDMRWNPNDDGIVFNP